MSLLIEQPDASGAVRVVYYLQRDEYVHIKEMTEYLYQKKAIPRPTIGSYSKAAALKMFKELYHLLAEEKKEQQNAKQ